MTNDKVECIELLNKLLKPKSPLVSLEPSRELSHLPLESSESIHNIDMLLKFLYKSNISPKIKDKLIKVKTILDTNTENTPGPSLPVAPPGPVPAPAASASVPATPGPAP
jgi:hypothetical protein